MNCMFKITGQQLISWEYKLVRLWIQNSVNFLNHRKLFLFQLARKIIFWIENFKPTSHEIIIDFMELQWGKIGRKILFQRNTMRFYMISQVWHTESFLWKEKMTSASWTWCDLSSIFQHWLTELEILAMVFAAAIHDYEHTGTTNNFHIQTR
jgi:hypothetical protein